MNEQETLDGEPSPIDRPLLAYAFLAQATSTPGDIFGGLAPIFKPIFQGRVGSLFDADEFSKLVREFYGIEIHPWAIDDLAHRFEVAGLLRKISSGKAVSYVYSEVEGTFDQVSEADVRLLVRRFVDFAKARLSVHDSTIDEPAIEKAFLKQLVSTNFHAILIKPDAKASDVPSKNLLSLASGRAATNAKQEWQTKIASRSVMDVLAAAFIIHLYEEDRSAYELLTRIANGALVAEVVLNVQEPQTNVQLPALTVILDGPFLMALLDLSGEESTDYARRIFDKLSEHLASIAVFRHSVSEIRENLNSVIAHVRAGTGFGATARRLASSAFRTYVQSVVNDVDAAVKFLGVKILDAPSQTSGYQFFSVDEEEAFRSSLGLYVNPHAQTRDASSIASLIRLRRGATTKMSTFANARYLFITANPWVAERAAECVQTKKINRENEVPPALSDRYFAGLLWVVYGGKSQELTEYRLLANCATALEARSDVVSKVLRFLQDIDQPKADRFKALMTNERAGQYLMEFTLGDAHLIDSTQDALSTYDQIEAAIAHRVALEHRKEIEDIKRLHSESLASVMSLAEAQMHSLQANQLATEDEARAAQAETLLARQAAKDAEQRSIDSKHSQSILREERDRQVSELARKSVTAASRALQVREGLIVFGIAVGIFVATLLTLDFVVGDQHWMSYGGALALATLASLGMWKMPDRIFRRHLDAVRDRVLREKVVEYGIEAESGRLQIDWDKNEVKLMTRVQ